MEFDSSDLQGSDSSRESHRLPSMPEGWPAPVNLLSRGVREVDSDGYIRFANSAHDRLYAAEPGSLVGIAVWELLHDAERRSWLKAKIRRLVRERPDPRPRVARSRRRDGRVVDLEIDWNYRTDTRGQVVGFVSLVTDVTLQAREESHLERRLREEVARRRLVEEEVCRLEALFDKCPDALYSETVDGVLDRWNEGAIALFGFRRGEMIGQPARILVPEERADEAARLRARTLRGESTDPLRTVRLDHEGRRIEVRLAMSPIRDATGRLCGISTTARGLREQQVLEEVAFGIAGRERRRLAQDLREGLGQELTGLGYLAKSLEGKMLAQAAGLSRLAKVERAPAERLLELEESLRHGHEDAALLTAGLSQAVRRVLDLRSTLVPIEVEEVGLTPALARLATEASRRYSIRCELRGGEIRPVDEKAATQFYHIAREAVDNAARHGRAKEVILLVEDDGARLRLNVRDDGRGFDPDSTAGPGFGLRLMRYRAEMVGAGWEIASARDRGCSVTCWLDRGIGNGDETSEEDDPGSGRGEEENPHRG